MWNGTLKGVSDERPYLVRMSKMTELAKLKATPKIHCRKVFNGLMCDGFHGNTSEDARNFKID